MALDRIGFDLLLFVASLFIAWYVGASLWQRRLARRTMAHLLPVLQRLGSTDALEIRWVGSSGFRILAPTARPPFRRPAIIALFAPRQVLGLWVAARLRRRTDIVIVRADLDPVPRSGLEAYRGRSPRDLAVAARDWQEQPAGDLAVRSMTADAAERLRSALGDGPAARAVRRVSLSPQAPHLLLELDGAAVLGLAPDDIAELVRGIAELASLDDAPTRALG